MPVNCIVIKTLKNETCWGQTKTLSGIETIVVIAVGNMKIF